MLIGIVSFLNKIKRKIFSLIFLIKAIMLDYVAHQSSLYKRIKFYLKKFTKNRIKNLCYILFSSKSLNEKSFTLVRTIKN